MIAIVAAPWGKFAFHVEKFYWLGRWLQQPQRIFTCWDGCAAKLPVLMLDARDEAGRVTDLAVQVV